MGAQLNQIILSNIRNLGVIDLNFGPKFNAFVGPNGSGKTSLLEAIYLLGVGRSFRARSMRQIISFGAEQCLIRAKVGSCLNSEQPDVWLAVERSVNGSSQYKIDGQIESSGTELTKRLPVQLIDVNSHLLLEGGPDNRRQFIDWGVFHVEHSFLYNWRQMRRALEQRNAALKQRLTPAATWNAGFVKYAVIVSDFRESYVQRFKVIFLQMLQEMLGLGGVTIRYDRGWSANQELQAALDYAASKDLAYGFTTCGPHRANLEINIDGRPAKEVLSRGQIKIFVCIMLLARAKLLSNTRDSVFLIDDLHAELDKHSCSLFINAINSMGCQVFMTGIDADLLSDRLNGCITRLFHVEQGVIRQAS
jgi:DNA replication and repair protein RecF